MSSRDLTGHTLGNYRFLRKIGSGGFATVYQVEHIFLGTDHAAKVLMSGANDDDQQRFLEEAQRIAIFKCPNTIEVSDFVKAEGEAFYVMQYIPDGSLRNISLPLPITTITTYIHQIAESLQCLHNKGLVHRDIKPDNLLMGPNGKILVSDFGIASLTSSFTVEQDTIGSIHYMPPEQFKGGARRSSDQYSLAIVVYQWLCGELPFKGDYLLLWYQHERVEPPSLCEQIPGLSKDIEAVIFRALAKNPDERFPTITEFAQALEKASLLPGESYYPPHVALAMRERYYGSFTNPWSGKRECVMPVLGQPAEIPAEIAHPHTSRRGTVGYIRPFEHGYICWSKRGGAQQVWLGFGEVFREMESAEGLLGFPLTSEERAWPSPQGTTGVFQRFEGRWDFPEEITELALRYGASLYYSEKYGVYNVEGDIGVCYERLGGTGSPLGFPTSRGLEAGPSKLHTKGWYKSFEGGSIYWSEKTGAHAVLGEINKRHQSEGGTKGRLGFPLADEEDAEDSPQGTKGKFQRFEGRDWDKGEARIYASAKGACYVWGGNARCYNKLGTTRSALGFPTSVNHRVTSSHGTEGWYQRFEGGTMYRVVKFGSLSIPVLEKMQAVYKILKGPKGKFGFPMAPEEVVEGLRMQQFEGGVICIAHEEQ